MCNHRQRTSGVTLDNLSLCHLPAPCTRNGILMYIIHLILAEQCLTCSILMELSSTWGEKVHSASSASSRSCRATASRISHRFFQHTARLYSCSSLCDCVSWVSFGDDLRCMGGD